MSTRTREVLTPEILCNTNYMITKQDEETIRGWVYGRLPQDWHGDSTEVHIDREEVLLTLQFDDVVSAEGASEAEASAQRVGRAKAFREETREVRMKIAREAEAMFDRKISWAVRIGAHHELFTHVSVPVMTRLKQPQRQVLDTLIDAGVARSRSDALAWCVRLVERHTDDWLTELREAMTHVDDVRSRGPV